MSEQLIEVLAKTRTGAIQPFRVLEIISIDGKPYTGAGDIDALLQSHNHLAGRVTALENILSPKG